MACASCAVGKDGKPGGCSGNCSGGCNRMNTFDWLAQLDIQDVGDFDLVEVNFKNGARKEFYHNPSYTHASTGDWVLLEVPGGGGFDVGKISLSGDLVRMQMKKKNIKEGSLFLNVIRKANQRDLEKLDEIRRSERDVMIKARVIARTLDLDMKIGDVEFQGDGRKVTFYYTADGRVDFRELIRHYAKEFKVKIEMRQIGARQESSRLGGIGSCGRELCCSTWLSDFKSVSTTAARYQQLAINQAKLSGMCGRLKCCLNYELDTYLDALEEFPRNPEKLKTQSGMAILIKTDVFRGLMVYTFDSGPERGKFYTVGIAEVKEVLRMNERGEMPPDLKELQTIPTAAKNASGDEDDEDDDAVEYGGDLVGAIELPDDKKKKKKKKKKNNTDRSLEARNDSKAVKQNPLGQVGAKPKSPDTQSGQKQPQQPKKPHEQMLNEQKSQDLKQREQKPKPPITEQNRPKDNNQQKPTEPQKDKKDFKNKRRFNDKKNTDKKDK